MPGDENIIESDVVRIAPDLTGFRAKLNTELAKALKGVNPTIKVKLVADTAGFNQSVRAALTKAQALKNAPTYKVKLVADGTGFLGSVRAELRKTAAFGNQPTYKVKVVADTSDLNRMRAKLGDKTVKVNVDTDGAGDAEKKFKQLQSKMDALHAQAEAHGLQRVRSGAEAEQRIRDTANKINLAKDQAAADARSKVLEREAERRGKAIAAYRKAPPIIDFGGQGIKPGNLLIATAVALSPALLAVASSAVQASTSIAALGAASIGAALGIGGLVLAFGSVLDAFKLSKTVENEVASSADGLAAAAANALAARRELTNSMRDEIAAQLDLNDARIKAAKDLVDLRQKLLDLQNQEKSDSLSVDEAKAKSAAMGRNVFASGLEKARAKQDVNDAITQLSDTRKGIKDTKADLKTSVRNGVEKDPQVLDAKDRVLDSHDRVADARKALATANKKALGSTSSAAEQLKKKLAEMSPAGRELYHWLKDNDGMFKRLRRTIETGVLPGFTHFLKAVSARPKGGGKTTLEIVADAMAELGGIIGDTVGKFGDFTRTPFFRTSFAKIQTQNAKAFKLLGKAALTLVKPITSIVVAAAPLFTSFAKRMDHFATWFDTVIEKAKKSGSLKKWFEDASHEAGIWLGIIEDAITILGNLFKLSLPTGNSLVQKLSTFMKDASAWSSSPNGQKSITKFFEFFRDLNYGEITRFFTGAAALFVALRAVSWAKANPFFTAFGIFAASHPELAAKAMMLIAEGINLVLGGIVAHPEAAITLLAIMSGMKAAKAFGIDLKLPVVDKLKDLLTSKFKFLDKFLGGGTTTGVMTVHAGVVNVYGGVGLGGGDLPLPGGKNAGGKAAATIEAEAAAAAKAAAKASARRAVLATLSAVGPIAPLPFDDDPNKDKIWAAYLAAKAKNDAGKPEAAVPNFAKPFIKREAGSFEGLKAELGKSGIDSAASRAAMKQYVGDRKKSVDTYVRYIRSSQGPIAAEKAQADETKKSKDTLAALLKQYGYNSVQAGGYAAAVFDVGNKSNAAAFDVAAYGKKADKTRVQVKALKDGTVSLVEQLDKVTGKRVATVTINDQTQVFNTLGQALTYQRALQTGVTLKAAAQAVKKDNESTAYYKNLYGLNKKARGGPIAGPGTGTSDSVPAMLSDGEYVHTAAATKHYGTKFMDAVNNRQLPQNLVRGYAKGGPVSWTFPTDLSKTLIPAVDDGGTFVGDSNVAAVAEATARSMHASDKQLLALFEAGIVESGLRNLNYGDRDSVGFLQQRAGWGSLSERMNVAHATASFIRKAKNKDTQGQTAGQLAQAVQVSAFPRRYDERAADAAAVLNALPPYLAGFTGGFGGNAQFGPWPRSAESVHGHDSGIWRKIINLVPPGLDSHLYGTLYNNRRTDNGTWSWHASGRAVDFMGFNQDKLARFFEARQPSVLELIHRTDSGDYGIQRGHDHNMGHEYGLHKNHLHVAMAHGGEVRQRTYDTGGVLPPGYTMAFNGTGRNEQVHTPAQTRQLATGPQRFDPRDLALMAAHIAVATSGQTIRMDGRAVAEQVHGYDYLPRGV